MSLHVHSLRMYVLAVRIPPCVGPSVYMFPPCESLRVYEPSCALLLCIHVPSVCALFVYMSLCMSVPSLYTFLCLVALSFLCLLHVYVSFVYTSLRVDVPVEMQACGDVKIMIMIGQRSAWAISARVIPAYFVGQRRFRLLVLIYHHLEIINQAIEPMVEELSYILEDSSISCDHYLLTVSSTWMSVHVCVAFVCFYLRVYVPS